MRRRALWIVALFPLIVMGGIVALRPGIVARKKWSPPGAIEKRTAIAEVRDAETRHDAPVSGDWTKGGSLEQSYLPEGVRLSGEWGDLRLSLRDIRIGEQILTQGSPVEPVREGNEIRYRRGAVVEKYVACAGEVEQVFVLEPSVAPSASQGDLRIRIALDTSLATSQRGNRLQFRNTAGSLVVTYGAATAIDAAGRRAVLDYSFHDNELTMVLGATFLSTAQFPLVVDPLIGTNFAVDDSIWEDMDPDVAYSGSDRYLVVYYEKNTDNTTKGDVVCYLASTAGQTLDSKCAEDSAVDSRGPKVASGNGNTFLVVWEQAGAFSYWEIWGRFLTCSSTTDDLTLAGSAFKIAGEPLLNLRRPDVGFSESTGRFLVAWERETSASNHDIFARTVSSAISLGTLITITQDNGNDDLRLTVSPRSENERMGVVWVRRKVGDTKGDLWGRSVQVADPVADPVAFFPPASITNDSLNDDSPHLGGTLPDDCFLTWSRDKGVGQWMTVAQKVKFTSISPGLFSETYFEIDNSGTNTVIGAHCDAATLAVFHRAVFVFNHLSASSSTGMDIHAAVYDTAFNPPQRVEPTAPDDWLKISVAAGNQSSSTVALNRFDLTALVTFDYQNKDIIGQLVRLAPHTVSPPSTPSGPAVGATGVSYGYSTGGSTCNLGHVISYRFDWGGGATSLFAASPASHAWSLDGAHSVKAQARCEAGELSDWSTDALSVTTYYPPAITSPSSPLLAGMVGVAATATQFQATGTQPITWSVSNGSPPPGMTLTSQGIYSGTPTVAGTYTFTVKAQNPGAPTTKVYTHQILAAPLIVVSPNALSFTLPEGSGLFSQALAISNGGGGTLNWSQVVSSSAPTPWLTATPSSGTNSGTVTVSVTPSGLQPGSYGASIILTAADASNSPQSVPITVSIAAVPPTISGPASLPDVLVGSAFTTTFSAAGSAPITWGVSPEGLPPGMTFATGVYSGTPTTPGSYTFMITASNSAGSTSKSLTHQITIAGPLTVTPESGFSSSGTVGGTFSPLSKSYKIQNPGTAVMTWDSSTSVSWLKVSPSHGNVPKGDSVDVAVSIGSSAQSLGAGVYTGAVTFLAGNEQVTRTVYLTVGTAEMTVTDAEGFSSSGNPAVGFSPPSKQYEVKNSGTAPMTWEAMTPAAWLKLTNTGGTLNPSQVSMVTVEVVAPPTGLAVGNYASSVTFANKTNGAGTTTRAVNLTVGSTAGPMMVTPGGSSSFGGLIGGPFKPLSVTYTVGNAGLSPIAWSAATDQPWISLSPTSGTLSGGQNEAVTITLTPGAQALLAGNYSATLTFTNTANGIGNATREIKLSVGGLSVGPSEGLSASGPQGGSFDPATATYVLTNNGTTEIAWSASVVQAWIALSQTQGTLQPQATTSVTVSLNGAADTLSAGTYADVVKFTNTTNGIGDTQRSVTLNVVAPQVAAAAEGGGGGGGCGLVGLDFLLALGIVGWIRRRRRALRKNESTHA